jgi:hypothetical protein
MITKVPAPIPVAQGKEHLSKAARDFGIAFGPFYLILNVQIDACWSWKPGAISYV